MKSYFCQKYNKLTDIFAQITKAFFQLCMITLIMASTSCSVTRHLEKDETLLVKNKINIKKAPKISESEIENYIQQPPKIGRASCRERVKNTVVAIAVKKKKK